MIKLIGLFTAKRAIVIVVILTLSATGAFAASRYLKAPVPLISPMSSLPIPTPLLSPSPLPTPESSPSEVLGASTRLSPTPTPTLPTPSPTATPIITPSPCPDATLILGRGGSDNELEGKQKYAEYVERTGCKLEGSLEDAFADITPVTPNPRDEKKKKLADLNWCVPINNQGPRIGFYSGEPEICDGSVDPQAQWFRDCIASKKPMGDYAKTMEAVDQCVDEMPL